METEIQFSPDQVQAIETITEWAKGHEQLAVLGGLAGTGKSTVTAHLIENVFSPEHTLVGCPTGKAAAVLRAKKVMAETIHSIAYQYIGRNVEDRKKLDFVFEGVNCSVLIIDEASMVNAETHGDLMRSGARLLYVGDYGQLPPVGKDPGIMQNMTAQLTHVHRSGDDLLDFAHAVRQNEYWPFETGNVRRQKRGTDEAREAMNLADIVICQKNSTRHRTNLQLLFDAHDIPEAMHEHLRAKWFSRDIAGFLETFLGRSIQVMCVKNNRNHAIWNGSLATLAIERVSPFGVQGMLTDDAGREFDCDASLEGWGTNPGDVDWKQNDPQIALDLGYCITCHKAQGSEFDRVAVLDQTYPRMSDRARWRYTAATRAKKLIDWIPWGKE